VVAVRWPGATFRFQSGGPARPGMVCVHVMRFSQKIEKRRGTGGHIQSCLHVFTSPFSRQSPSQTNVPMCACVCRCRMETVLSTQPSHELAVGICLVFVTMVMQGTAE
jgi:hypothetical protein